MKIERIIPPLSLDIIERGALLLVSRLGPWLSPVPPAYFIARAAEKHLTAAPWVAVTMAVAVEAVGIAAIHTTLRAYTWNQEKRKTDPAAPLWLGIVLSVAYLVIGILLAVLLELYPGLAPLAVAAFFVLAAIAYITLAMIADQARRETETTEARAREKAERNEKRNAKPEHKAGTWPEQITGTVPELTDRTREQARTILAERSGISGAELGRLLGTSDSFGRRLKRELSIHRNGTGTNVSA